MKKRILLLSLGMIMQFNVHAGHDHELRQRTKREKNGPVRFAMKKESSNKFNELRKQYCSRSCMKEGCMLTLGAMPPCSLLFLMAWNCYNTSCH